MEVYDNHINEIDIIYQSCVYDLGIVCGDFNLLGVNWNKNYESLLVSGIINDKVRLIDHQYALLQFTVTIYIQSHMSIFSAFHIYLWYAIKIY